MQCFSINGVMGINVVVAESIFFFKLELININSGIGGSINIGCVY